MLLLHERDPPHRVELAQDHDGCAERVRQRRERQRSGVVKRAGGQVHRVLVEETERVEQREDDLAVGTRAQRALRLAGRTGGVDQEQRIAGVRPCRAAAAAELECGPHLCEL